MITLSNIPSLLRPGLFSVFEDYNTYPQWWRDVFSTHRSNKSVEYDQQMQSLGLAQLKSEAGPIALGSMQQEYATSYVMQYYGIGFAITRAAILDNQYQKDFPMASLAMRNSLETLKNYNAASIFNNARTTPLADGQPLSSVAHPTATGTLANTFGGPVDISEASVEDAITIIKGWTNVAGLPINMMPQCVLTSQALAFTSARIFKSEYQNNTPNNAISAIYHDKYMPRGYMVSQFISNPADWFILTDEPNGFKYFLREPLEMDFIEDTLTQTLTNVAFERYAFGCSNWRAAFCARGT